MSCQQVSTYLEIIIITLKMMKMQVHVKRVRYQTQRMFMGFMMLMGSMQRLSWFSIVPVGPYLWKVHFDILGNTLVIGSTLFSISMPVTESETSKSEVVNCLPK